MKRLLCVAATSLVTFVLASVATAADLGRPIYKAPPTPLPVWSWTGLYIGVNAGGSIGRDPTTLSVGGFGPSTSFSQTLSPAGFIGGGQLGYNYQFASNWVAGIEGDFQGASQKDSSCLACGSTSAVTVDQKVEWFATLRGRLGYTNGDWLWYVTGGAAWAQVHNDLTITGFLPGSESLTQSGWVIGGGVETHLAGNWTAKLEYLYMDLGSITDVATTGPVTFTQTSDIRDNIVRVGINYKFY